jgi:hypothetical protein
VLTLSACGQGAPPAAPPADAGQAQAALADPPDQNIQCGTVPAADGLQAKVIIRQGAVDCAEAVTLLTQYFGRLTPSAIANPDGAGPVALDPWTCGSDPGSVLTATCSTEDGREVGSEPAR